MAKFRVFGSLALFALSGTACVDIPQDAAPPVRVAAIFDHSTAVIPLPNSALLDPDGTLPDLGGTAAEGEFHAWLSKSHGWEPSTPITLPFSGKLDQGSFDAGVTLYRVEADRTLTELDATIEYAENIDGMPVVCNPVVCGSQITVVPSHPLQSGVMYAAVATTALKGANGFATRPSRAMFFAASEQPLVDASGASVIASLDNASARDFEGLRGLMAPVFAALEEHGVDKREVVTAAVWRTSTNAFTILDPATATLPLPNTLALEADGTFPRASLGYCGAGETPKTCAGDDDCTGLCQRGTCVTTSCAQGVFDDYLDGLHGWPPTTPMTLPVSAPLSPETVNTANIKLYRIAEEGLEEVAATVEYESGATSVTINASVDLNAKYLAFATQDIHTADTDAAGRPLPLLPAVAIAMAVQPFAVISTEGKSLVAEISDAQAQSIDSAQKLLRPLAEAVEATAGVRYQDLAAIWTWGTWSDSFIVFDPATERLPFPTAFATTGCPADRPVCGVYDPANPLADPLQNSIFDEVSRRDGFSTTSPNWLPTEGAPLDESTITTDNVLLAETDTMIPTRLPADDYAVSYSYENIFLDLGRPLKPGTLVAGIATTGIMGQNGFPAQPSAAFVFLRSDFPLVDDAGRSQIDVLDDMTAAQLESARQAYSQLWLAAQVFGYQRKQVISAWAYTTETATKPLQELRAKAMAKLEARDQLVAHRACEPGCGVDDGLLGPLPDDATYAFSDEGDRPVDLSAVDLIQFDGEIESVSVLDVMRHVAPYDEFTEPRIGVSVAVPKTTVGCAAPFDVAVVQHGLGDYRKQMLLSMANHLAQRCIATVAIDLPLHGGRSIGSTDLHPSVRPANSGEGFLTGDLPSSANNLMQAVVDLSVAIRFVKAGGLNGLVGVPVSDETSKIGYVGISMGGFAGTLASTLDPAIQASVLNVTGGNYAIVFTQSEAFSSLLTDGGIVPGSFMYLQTLHFIQWLGEKVDPYAFAPALVKPIEDLSYDPGTDTFATGPTMPTRDVMVQMADMDDAIPNTSTKLLAKTLGVSLDDTTFFGTFHGFLSSGISAQSTCARDQAAAWLSSSFQGSATIPTDLVAATCVASRGNR